MSKWNKLCNLGKITKKTVRQHPYYSSLIDVVLETEALRGQMTCPSS